MNYENLKKVFIEAINQHYEEGMPINDIRAAIHAADLMAEQFGALELLEMAKSMAGKTDA